jgi:hypothetical protein
MRAEILISDTFYIVKMQTRSGVFSILSISQLYFDLFSSGWSQSLDLFLGYKLALNDQSTLSMKRCHRVRYHYFEPLFFFFFAGILSIAFFHKEFGLIL